MPDLERIKRSAFATFLNVGDATTPSYKRFGKGIEEQDINYNPELETTKYIDEDNPTNDLVGYAPNFDTTQKTYKNEPIFEYMYDKMLDRAIGTEAVTDYLKVFLFDKLAEGIYTAEKCDCTVAISSFKGSEMGYSINENGDPTKGYVTISTSASGTTITFTAGQYTPPVGG